jgi:hypothetical protein
LSAGAQDDDKQTQGGDVSRQFETDRYAISEISSLQLVDQRCGRDKRGEVDVWIESDAFGKRFLRQDTIQGKKTAIIYGIYSQGCYFLQEKATGRYFFLEMAARGFFLQSDGFYGADFYGGNEATRIRDWLVENARPRASAPAEGVGNR